MAFTPPQYKNTTLLTKQNALQQIKSGKWKYYVVQGKVMFPQVSLISSTEGSLFHDSPGTYHMKKGTDGKESLVVRKEGTPSTTPPIQEMVNLYFISKGKDKGKW